MPKKSLIDSHRYCTSETGSKLKLIYKPKITYIEPKIKNKLFFNF